MKLRTLVIPFLVSLGTLEAKSTFRRKKDSVIAIYPDEQPVYSSVDGELSVSLSLGEAMYESDSLKQKVIGYNGKIGGPTLRVKPGDTLKIHFTNNLPPEACNTSVPEMWNQYHGVSVTNLHLHGMRVPDAVNPWKLKIEAGQSYNFTVKIPNDHQGGTNWYHPHSQGSSTLQAGGGGLGLLIVEDEKDDLPKEVLNLPEVNLRIQFFNFTYLQQDFATGTAGSYVPLCKQHCLPAENRGQCNEYFYENGPDAGKYNTTFAPDGLEYETLLVNGVEKPTIKIAKGQWYRFRTLFVPTRFRTIEPSILADECEFKLLAKDGKYIPIAPRDVHSGFMASGARADFLVRCNEAGTYEFRSLSESRDSSNWISSQKLPSLDRIIAYLEVGSDKTPKGKAPKGRILRKREKDEIPLFQVARPCYLPDMTSIEPDHSSHIVLSGLTPDVPAWEIIPGSRPECCSKISYYAVNTEGPLSPSFQYTGPEDPDNFAFKLSSGSIWEVDFYVASIHPWH